MKSNRRWSRAVAVPLIFAAAARADLSRWVQDLPSPSQLQAVFFRSMPLPSGPVQMRRPPKETRAELSKLIQAAPTQADLYALRAHEDELQLDFASAEADWKRHVQLAANPVAANLEIADFYHRRIRPREEIAALEVVGRAPDAPQSWDAWHRIQSVIHDQALAPELSLAAYRGMIARFPKRPEAYQEAFRALAAAKQTADAERILAEYRRAFPEDDVFPIEASASLAGDAGLSVYDREFRPLWPPPLIKAYFTLLKERHALRTFLDAARSQAASRPGDLGPAARLFHYYAQQERPDAGIRALYEFRQRKEAAKNNWTPEELWTLGQLFDMAHAYDDAARAYLALYKLGPAQQERSLAAIAALLLAAPDQPLRVGAGDLSFYRDIATLDPGPGFLNGILSLLFNSTTPQSQFDTENQASRAYFHRAKAAELISEFARRYPASPQRPALQARLIEAYVTYGDDAGILRAGREFLTTFPKSEQRTQVSLAMADAYARRDQTKEEFAIYDEQLKYFPPTAPDYGRILDRYVGRLAALKRLPDALALYRREIDRNPDDPGLYEKLVGFLEQNKMGAQVEEVYRKAMARFPDRSWSHKLARWYLRQKQVAQFDALTREVVKIFSGTELETYLTEAAKGQPLTPVLYRQVNTYAHQRFPNNLTFVRNLINNDPASREVLLRTYWFQAADLRDRYFESLSRAGRLKTELAAIQKPDASVNPAAVRFAAEAEAWQSHFESAAPLLRAYVAEYPGEIDQQSRAASLYRSLATYDVPGNSVNTEVAVGLQQNRVKAVPLDAVALMTVGEIYADRERFSRARPLWNRVATLEPGTPGGFLDSATVFWDYYRFDDALRMIGEARQRLHDDRLFAYEAGAIYENRRDYVRALQEYAKGAYAAPADPQSRSRVVQLARRPNLRGSIDTLTAQRANGPDASLDAISLRLDVLAAQNRGDDLRQFLFATGGVSNSPDVLAFVNEAAATRALDAVQERAKLRQITLLTDPVERMQARIDLAKFYESHANPTAAASTIDALYRDNPNVLGVVRAAVDYHWRNKEPKAAIDLLAQAAAKAQPTYRDPFTLEAARKATESSDIARARDLLAPLLAAAPQDASYIAAMADTYARQNDDQGLRVFYSAKLAAADSVDRKSAMRRALVPVLTRLKDYASAVDQYLEILNRYPEDADLAREVAVYAASHGRAAQLTAYYDNTEKQSPQDFRWPLVNARLQAHLENFPAAVGAYQRASALRPDRIEFYSERASLEERLLRFDEAAATYTKLYDLSYHNSQWMERVATVRARQGRVSDTVQALNTAYVAGRPPTPDALFAIAQKLESFDMLAQAKDFAQRAVVLAGPSLIADHSGGAAVYLRIMTRLRQYEPAYRIVDAFFGSNPFDPTLSQAMGLAVGRDYTPQEKVAFAAFVTPRLQRLLPALAPAGLLDLQAKALASSPNDLVPLQQRRLRFGELGAQLESYWKQLAPDSPDRDTWLDQAATHYRLAGDAAGELRVLTAKARQSSLRGLELERFAALVARDPARLIAVASSDPSQAVRDAVANCVERTGPSTLAFQTVAARGKGLPPVWTRAYTALTGLYYATLTAPVSEAFTTLLNNAATIGARLGKPTDRDQQLAGDLWFYYGARYGEYLGLSKSTDAEDYLPAALEARPGSSDAYFQLGEYYNDARQADRALDQYRQALQLSPNRADAHDRVAALLARQGKGDEAIAEFRAALSASSRALDARLNESFLSDVQTTLEDIGRAKLLEPVRPDADRLLRIYIRRNGNYRVDALLQGALAAAVDPAVGINWVIDLSLAAAEPSLFLGPVAQADYLNDAQRIALYRALISRTRAKLELEAELRRYQTAFLEFLIDRKRGREAQAELAELPPLQRTPQLEVRIALLTNTIPALLARYAADANTENRLTEIRDASNDPRVLEFVYSRQLEARQLDAATFLGLAEIRLKQNNVAAAVALLRRMTMVVGEPFENLNDAADLLIRTGHRAEAKPFLEDRIKAVPWDTAARAKLEDKAPPSITLADAEKPYVYAGRLQLAAQTTDLAVKIRLLQAAVAIDPAPSQPILDLITAALDARRYQLALSASMNVQPDNALARRLGQAAENVGEFERARALYRTAGDTAGLRRLQATLERQRRNDGRRPVITQNLEQDHPVRPRLTAAAGVSQ